MRLNRLGQPIGEPLETELPRPRPDRKAMRGRFVTLLPTDPAHHADALFSALAEGDRAGNWTYLPYGPFPDAGSFGAWMAAQCTGEDPRFFTVMDAASESPLGLTSFLRIKPDAGSIEIGHIHFSPRLQGTAKATEAIFLMLRRAFDELGYRRCEWKCDALNARSRGAAQRLGFTFEGVFRKATHYKGRNRDTAWFAITNDAWPRIRSGYAAWLDPGNFDADGRQLTRLRFD